MWNLFEIYFSLGKDHILDQRGVDHILFIIALAAVYVFVDWKKVIILTTAFTIGHSITLALSVLEFVILPGDVIEYMIPCTIIFTACGNLIQGTKKPKKGLISYNHYFALFFGLVHGLGFSNYLKSILRGQDDIIVELLAFNVGLEVGQIVIVIVFLIIGYIAHRLIGINRRDWNIGVSSAAIGMSILLLLNI